MSTDGSDALAGVRTHCVSCRPRANRKRSRASSASRRARSMSAWPKTASRREVDTSSSATAPASRRASEIRAISVRKDSPYSVNSTSSVASRQSTHATRTSRTTFKPSWTRRSATRSDSSCAAATRIGRSHTTSSGSRRASSHCFGPRGINDEISGFSSCAAWMMSARVTFRSASSCW